jgi:hypothetical protein
VFAQKAPAPVKKAVSWVAAIALALLVALIVFGEGGGGLFGRGGGTGEGKGTNPEEKGKSEPNPAVVPPKKDEIPSPKPVEPVPLPKTTDAVIRVTILGGADVPGDERYYLTDDDPKPKTFPELKDAILARKKEKGTVAISVHFRPTNAPSRNPPHYSITQLTKWAEETAKVNVILPAQQ